MKIEFENLSGVSYTHLKNVASTDNLRPAMQGVNINLKQSRLECTDAHLLMLYPIKICEGSNINPEIDSVIVPIRFFNHLKYMVDIPRKFLGAVKYFLLDEFAEVHFGNELVYRCRYIDAQYPIIDAVLPNVEWKREEVKEIGFNLNIIGKLTQAFPKEFPNNVKFNLYSQNKGVLVEQIDGDVKGIVMPIMVNF